jgi:hypothetical protein
LTPSANGQNDDGHGGQDFREIHGEGLLVSVSR